MGSYHDLGIRERPLVSARHRDEPLNPRFATMAARADDLVAQPLVGVTTAGVAVPGLFPVRPTGVSTAALVDAARAFLGAVGPAAQLPLDSDALRRWHNVHAFLFRHGALLEDLNDAARSAALALVRATLSPAGFELTRDVMRLNHTIGELTQRWQEYGEWVYWLTVFGEPSATEPWGWQLDGHHVNLSCMVIGDQVVLTPAFLGSEPCWADEGDHRGVRVFDAETSAGLTLVRSLDVSQRRAAVLADSIMPGELAPERMTAFDHRLLGGAYADNAVVPYEGLPGAALGPGQLDLLMALVDVYVDRQAPGHTAVRRDEIRRHLGETRFLWLGDDRSADGAFYYRVHSPVLWIEFDHQPGIAFANDEPTRHHVHTVVRTPNGNDYGHDFLRQHYATAHAGGRSRI